MKHNAKLLAFIILTLANNISFAAETITTNTRIDVTKNYSGNVTIQNCRYEINAAVTVNGDFSAEGATIVIGENGSLHVTGSFTCQTYYHWSIWDGTTTTKSDITINGNLTVDRDMSVSGRNSNYISTITINENAELHSRNLTIGNNSDLTLSGKAFVAQTATINDYATVASNAEINTQNLTVGNNGELTLSGKADVAQTTTINGSALVNDGAKIDTENLTVGNNGDLTLSGKADVAQTTTINGSTIVNSGAKIDTGNLTVGNNGDLTLSGKADVAQTTTINGSTIVNSGAEINTDYLTVGNNGDLTLSGKADVAQTTTINGSTIVNSGAEINTDYLTVGNNGDLTISGRILTEEATTINGSATVNSDAILYTKSDLTIGEYGELALNQGSYTIIEGDLYQDGDTPISLGILFPHQGDIQANNATLVVAGDYTIWEGWASGADQNSDFPDPSQNEDFFVFGSNNLNIINKINSSPGSREDFDIKHPNGLAGYIIDILPIELVYFTADEIGGGVRFAWETASELNNDYFTIEYSIDAVEFTELTTIEGAGTTTEPKYYRYTDFSSNCGIVYYRLKQTDFDGKYSYSKIVSVTFAENQITDSYNYFVYPNPAFDRISIGGGDYDGVSFMSANGSVLRREAASGSHDITRLPKGLNFVIIHTSNGDISERFIKR